MATPRPPKHNSPPTKLMMKVQFDPILHTYVKHHGAFKMSDAEASRLKEFEDFHIDDLLALPGVCVKGVYGQGGATIFGKLASFQGFPVLHLSGEPVEVVVASTSDHCVWTGTVRQYFETFCVD